jgi:hypothetical protein
VRVVYLAENQSNRLKSSAIVRRLSGDDTCECEAKETVVYILVDYPRLSTIRRELRMRVGDNFNSIAQILGS